MKDIDSLRKSLETAIKTLPEVFYSTFQYTKTGNNLTHPITVGLIAAAVRKLPRVKFVGIDVKLNEGGSKFYPDVVAFSSIDNEMVPLLIVDYESPNSSDMRIPKKDVAAYRKWVSRSGHENVPYVIITTLPDSESKHWQLRYTTKLNASVKSKKSKAEMRRNPKAFWYKIYKQKITSKLPKDVYFLNISEKDVQRIR